MEKIEDEPGVTRKCVLTRIRPEKNERRFYAIEVTNDLFGRSLLSRNWGRVGTAGRQRYDLHQDRYGAMAALAKLDQRKRSRGYSG
jgi:predicted DNA-binding WGR domain protein